MVESDFVIVDGVLKEYRSSVPNPIIPEGVTEIGKRAFFMKNIRSVYIPDSVKIIGDGAFSGCHYLGCVGWPMGIEEIGRMAFMSCPNLVFDIPSSIKKIDKWAFRGCTSMNDVDVPESCELDPEAFGGPEYGVKIRRY